MAKANAIKSKRMLGIEEETGTNDDELSELPKRVFADWLTDHIEGIRRNPSYAASTYRNYRLEKPRDFDPFGQTGLSPLATI